MTAEQRTKICKRMLLIIPGMILAIISDYVPRGIRAIRNDEGEIDR